MTPEEKRKQTVLSYQHVFGSEEGANVLADLSRFCFENYTTFFGNSERMSAFTEGKRAVILYVRSVVSAKPDDGEPTRARTEEDEDNA